MAAPARFLFDTDFAAPPPRAEPDRPAVPMIELAQHEARLAEEVRAAHERGLVEGRKSEEAKAARTLVGEAARLAGAVEQLLAGLDGTQRQLEAQAMRLSEAIAHALAGGLVERQPRDMVLSVIDEALGPLRRAPHLVLRVAGDDSVAIRDAVVGLASERGFEGRLVVLSEPGLQRGDCRIEWADGGIVVDRAAIAAKVGAAIEAHLAALEPQGDSDSGETP